MLVRVVVVVASLACSAQSVAEDVSSDATAPQPPSAAAPNGGALDATANAGADARVETAPASQPGEFTTSDRVGKPVSFGRQPERALPMPAVATDSPQQPDDVAQQDPLNAPFWVFLLWYMGSR
ncbi:MAG: hypothetical protein GWN84_11215 [Gammaproteobacteria bacterium]|nr:hypothetical protein [Gammaproteobacteria bacterium]NIR83434.1 hypothetical protein [Gammaproteobacteria bacterium]NIR91356.1 hypothetical protein [Gammaproteobacteria bacterium]NIU04596.1 hypothetical protein [Gammaproteobacteria bacterium]NIV51638.1 hypothetical protein [Gammaproteobacteria bacterium]